MFGINVLEKAKEYIMNELPIVEMSRSMYIDAFRGVALIYLEFIEYDSGGEIDSAAAVIYDGKTGNMDYELLYSYDEEVGTAYEVEYKDRSGMWKSFEVNNEEECKKLAVQYSKIYGEAYCLEYPLNSTYILDLLTLVMDNRGNPIGIIFKETKRETFTYLSGTIYQNGERLEDIEEEYNQNVSTEEQNLVIKYFNKD